MNRVYFGALNQREGEKADTEYDKFKERTKDDLSPVEIHFLENFERERKRLSDD